jgi:hypothetical protein
MSHLITDSSADVQKMAYQLLRVAARKRTEYLVIEAAAITDAEGEEETPVVQEIKAAGLIPAELLDIIQGEVRNFVIDDDDDDDELVRLSLHNHPYEANHRVEFVRLDVGMDAHL